jgi:tRNA (mo5U34)-methyltransferase
MRPRGRSEAERFVAESTFHWHQRFELAPGVLTPGDNDVAWLLRVAQVPDDLEGMSVLDIGASNGGVCFELERRNAGRIVAVDVCSIEHCGFDSLTRFLGSRAEFIRATIYELPSLLDEQFDLVFFWGVLYHLRHPLLALDRLRSLVRDHALVETAVCDHELGRASRLPYVRFYAGDELNRDPTNWFSPSTAAVLDWCSSSGFEATLLDAWPYRRGKRLRRAYAKARGAFGSTGAGSPTTAQRLDDARGTAERCMLRLVPTASGPDLQEVSWAEWSLRIGGQP